MVFYAVIIFLLLAEKIIIDVWQGRKYASPCDPLTSMFIIYE